MKQIKILFVAFFALVSVAASAHDKTDSVKVYGNCGMCKSRIEKAAQLEGVKKADWNEETKMLTVIFDGHIVKLNAIEKAIAGVGHDTKNFTADPAVYKKLPGCCKYDRKPMDDKSATDKADNHEGHNH